MEGKVEYSDRVDMTLLRTADKMFEFKSGKTFLPALGREVSYKEKWLLGLKAKAAHIQKDWQGFLAYNVLVPHLVAYYHHESRRAAIERGDLEFEAPEGAEYDYSTLMKSAQKCTKWMEKKVGKELFAKVKREAQFEFRCQVIEYFVTLEDGEVGGAWKTKKGEDGYEELRSKCEEVIKANSPDLDFAGGFNDLYDHVCSTLNAKFSSDG